MNLLLSRIRRYLLNPYVGECFFQSFFTLFLVFLYFFFHLVSIIEYFGQSYSIILVSYTLFYFFCISNCVTVPTVISNSDVLLLLYISFCLFYIIRISTWIRYCISALRIHNGTRFAVGVLTLFSRISSVLPSALSSVVFVV